MSDDNDRRMADAQSAENGRKRSYDEMDVSSPAANIKKHEDSSERPGSPDSPESPPAKKNVRQRRSFVDDWNDHVNEDGPAEQNPRPTETAPDLQAHENHHYTLSQARYEAPGRAPSVQPQEVPGRTFAPVAPPSERAHERRGPALDVARHYGALRRPSALPATGPGHGQVFVTPAPVPTRPTQQQPPVRQLPPLAPAFERAQSFGGPPPVLPQPHQEGDRRTSAPVVPAAVRAQGPTGVYTGMPPPPPALPPPQSALPPRGNLNADIQGLRAQISDNIRVLAPYIFRPEAIPGLAEAANTHPPVTDGLRIVTVKQGDLWRAGWMYGFQPTHLSSSYAPTAVLALEKLLEVSSEQLMQAFERAGKFGDARMR